MKYPFVFCPGRLPAVLFLFVLFQGAWPRPVFALNEEGRVKAHFLWSGSWEGDKSLINRGDLRLSAWGLILRGQVTDKRPVPPWEDVEKGITAPGAGLYHEATGSRFLYGIINETGLAVRLRNPAGRGIPFFESHSPSGADLKTEPSSTGKAGFYLNLASPPRFPLSGFASVRLDETPRWSGGMAFRFSPKVKAGIEGFYTGGVLPPRDSKAWFSAAPSLPERDFRLYGFNAAFSSPFINVASDLAYSETFSFGRDFYGNLGITLGNRPWRFSLAADTAGARFVGSDGDGRGALFRSAGRFEWRGRRSSLFRLSTSLRSPGLGEAFTRSSSQASYRFPNPSGKFPLGLSRLSLTVSRDASDPEEIADRIDASLGLFLGPVRSTLAASLTGALEESAEAAGNPYPGFTAARRFEAARISGDLSYALSPFLFKAKLAFLAEADRENRWDLSCSASVRGKLGWFSLKAGVEGSPSPILWTYAVSWRLNRSLAF